MINRRDFVKRTVLSSAGIIVPSIFCNAKNKEFIGGELPVSKAKYNLMEDVFKYKKIDAHVHIDFLDGGQKQNIYFAEQLGINKMMISRPITSGEG